MTMDAKEEIFSDQAIDLSFLRGRKVLITGGTGFIGRGFVEALMNSAAKIRITVHEQRSPFDQDRVEAVYADLTVPEDCIAACNDIDIVIHAAGSVGNAGNIRSNLVASLADNLVMAVRILEAASERCGKILIFSSGTTVYPPYNRPVREEDIWTGPPAPVYFGYGWMRRYFELFGEYVGSVSPLRVLVCRPTAVYGRHDRSGHIVPALVHRSLSGESPLVVWGTGKEERDFLHVSDLVRGCLLLLRQETAVGPINIGYGKTVTVADVARIVMRAAGRPYTDIVFDETKPTTIPVRAVDSTKAKELLGFTPAITLDAGIRDLVGWYRTQM